MGWTVKRIRVEPFEALDSGARRTAEKDPLMLSFEFGALILKNCFVSSEQGNHPEDTQKKNLDTEQGLKNTNVPTYDLQAGTKRADKLRSACGFHQTRHHTNPASPPKASLKETGG